MQKREENRGFTIIEAIVVIVIIGILLTVLVGRQSIYTNQAELVNTLDKIGYDMTRARVFSVGSVESSPGSQNFSYGLAFSLNAADENNSYIYFVDRDGDGVYDGDWSCQTGSAYECIEKIPLPTGYTISNLCINYVLTSGANCNNGAVLTSTGQPLMFFDRLYATFARPGVDTKFVWSGGLLPYPGSYNVTKFDLHIKDRSNNERRVTLMKHNGIVIIYPKKWTCHPSAYYCFPHE